MNFSFIKIYKLYQWTLGQLTTFKEDVLYLNPNSVTWNESMWKKTKKQKKKKIHITFLSF